MHLVLGVALAFLARSGLGAKYACKCAPGMPCWPSGSEWASLNETVSGRLIMTVPVASVCYPSEPAYNPETCQSVRSNWTTWPFHSADPASVGDPSVDNACSPIYANGTSVSGNPNAGKQGCSLGAYPPYIINATSAEDVQAGVLFAKKWNLRMNIKNTGHGGKRRSISIANPLCRSIKIN
ncbi:FAD binding domain protein [Aspergillus sclerotialis]|uniref:FAD binding domain protein n=1 Tax=Aspergillus sclerotialis TaxID=2070753 RepID=A0A3A3A2W0_9EURO|nr:FAD binding domain protein [Aspergillus sclerotialis]